MQFCRSRTPAAAHRAQCWWWRSRGWRCSGWTETRGTGRKIGSYGDQRSCRPTDNGGRTVL